MEHILFLNCAYPLEPLCRALRAGGVVSTVTSSLEEWMHLRSIRNWSLCVVAAETLADIPELPSHQNPTTLLYLGPDSLPKRFAAMYSPLFTGQVSASSLLRTMEYGGLLVADAPAELVQDGLIINSIEKSMWWLGEELALTPKQFGILRLLASQPGRIFSRVEIWEYCWGLADYPESNAVDAHIRRLRVRLPTTLGKCIRGSYGIGYRFVPHSKPREFVQDNAVFSYQLSQTSS